MKTRIENSNEIVGKTISGIGYEYGRGIVIAFTDDTFCYFRASAGYEGESELIEDASIDLGNTFLVDAGVMTREEFDKIIEDRKIKNAIQQEKREKQEYERLKAKFGNS